MLENKNRNLSTPPSTSLIIPLVHNRISGRPAFLCRLHIPRPALLYSLQTGFPPPSLVFGVCVVLLTPGATSPFPECPPPSARDSTPPPPMVSSHSLAILSESPHQGKVKGYDPVSQSMVSYSSSAIPSIPIASILFLMQIIQKYIFGVQTFLLTFQLAHTQLLGHLHLEVPHMLPTFQKLKLIHYLPLEIYCSVVFINGNASVSARFLVAVIICSFSLITDIKQSYDQLNLRPDSVSPLSPPFPFSRALLSLTQTTWTASCLHASHLDLTSIFSVVARCIFLNIYLIVSLLFWIPYNVCPLP